MDKATNDKYRDYINNMYANSEQWSKEKMAKVKEIDKEFYKHLEGKGIEKYTPEATKEWIEAGFQAKHIEAAGPRKKNSRESVAPEHKKHILDGIAGQEIWLDGEKLEPGPSQKIVNHSPTGFSWGYTGSGPAQLSAAIMLKLTGKIDGYQELKRRVIAHIKKRDFTIEFTLENREQVEDKGKGEVKTMDETKGKGKRKYAKVGAAWKHEKEGREIISGDITMNGTEFHMTVFPNSNKEKDSQPDFLVAGKVEVLTKHGVEFKESKKTEEYGNAIFGGGWTKDFGKEGQQLISVSFNVKGEKMYMNLLPNDHKKEEKHPDFNISMGENDANKFHVKIDETGKKEKEKAKDEELSR